jgi:hypothetical protein
MKRNILILILILIYFICGSRTCTEENNAKEINEAKLLDASKDSIVKEFEFGKLQDEHLLAFEETAEQKLSDFADYLKIVSDTSLDIIFRKKAVEMVRRIFLSEATDMKTWCSGYAINDISTLNQLLERSLLKGFPLWIQPVQIQVRKSLEEVNDSTYSGKLSFYQNCIPFDVQKPQLHISEKTEVDIYLMKKAKSFGDESFTIWEVYLGNFK